jgi:hypothetical protein
MVVPVASNMKNMTADPLVNRVIQRMADRSNIGMKTYGVTMERKDISTIDWMRHAQEEALDLAIYLERCITDLSAKKEWAEWNPNYPTKRMQNGWGG